MKELHRSSPELPRRKRRCSECDTPFSEGSRYHTWLSTKNKETPERMDFCEKCWHERRQKLTEEPTQSILWSSKVPSTANPPPSRYERILAWMQTLLSSEERKQRQIASILALFLQRHKKLALRWEKREGPALTERLYEVLPTGELLFLQVPPISGEEAQALQTTLTEALRHETYPIS